VLQEYCRTERQIMAIYPDRLNLSAKVRSFLDLAAKHFRSAEAEFANGNRAPEPAPIRSRLEETAHAASGSTSSPFDHFSFDQRPFKNSRLRSFAPIVSGQQESHKLGAYTPLWKARLSATGVRSMTNIVHADDPQAPRFPTLKSVCLPAILLLLIPALVSCGESQSQPQASAPPRRRSLSPSRLVK